MTTDPTPRDVHGEPLRVGRWYWRRRWDGEVLIEDCVKIANVWRERRSFRCLSDGCWDFAGNYQFLPDDGPPAWPGEGKHDD